MNSRWMIGETGTVCETPATDEPTSGLREDTADRLAAWIECGAVGLILMGLTAFLVR